MPNINENQIKNKYIDRESYDWSREQRTKDNKETFVYLTIGFSVAAVAATWVYLIIQKLRA